MTLKKANLVSESSILLPGIGTHKLQINSAMNFKLPLTERRAHSAASHQGRYNFTKPDSQGKWSSEGTLAGGGGGGEKLTFLFASPSVTSAELFLDYFSLSLFMTIIIFLEMYFWWWLSEAGIIHKSLIAERGIPRFKSQLPRYPWAMTFSRPLTHMTSVFRAVNKRYVCNNSAHFSELLWGLVKLPLKMPSTRPGL